MKTPAIKQNPHPIGRVELSLTIEGAPGNFDSINGYAVYQVENDDCVPLTKGSGARLAPEKTLPVELTRAGNIFKGAVYADQLQDENYFGLGVCHWKLSSVGANPKIKEYSLDLGSLVDSLRANNTAVTYFTNQAFINATLHGGEHDGGTVFTDYVAQHRREFFSVSLEAREVYK